MKKSKIEKEALKTFNSDFFNKELPKLTKEGERSIHKLFGKEKTLLPITNIFVQFEAKQEIDRFLTKEELDYVVDAMIENLSIFVRESISEAMKNNLD